jgi:hypothetical protein
MFLFHMRQKYQFWLIFPSIKNKVNKSKKKLSGKSFDISTVTLNLQHNIFTKWLHKI